MFCSSFNRKAANPARPWVLVPVIAFALLPGEAAADSQGGPLPMMDQEHEVTCHTDENGDRWRVQCDDRTRSCVYAPDAVLDADGDQARKLERARFCPTHTEPFDLEAWKRQGYTMRPGLADAPHGWTRDERGRVMQVEFDLERRMYIGGGYAPSTLGLSEIENGKRSAIDMGLLVLGHRVGRTRHRLRLVEGEIQLAPFGADIVLLHYDLSRDYRDPALRITSFFGKPRRHDIDLDLGAWLEAGELQIHTIDGAQERLWKLVTVHGTVDLWQSRDLYSFVRLRGGVGFENARSGDDERRVAVTPGGALEADITFDRAGFHHMGVELAYENPLYTTVDTRVGESARRMNARVEYEMIVLAINDQPLSLHLGVAAEKRNDSPLLPTRWTAKANAGLRFSLWAPARSR